MSWTPSATSKLFCNAESILAATNKHCSKKDNSRGVPEYSHVGTMIEGRTEYFTNRVTKKDKKRTLLESVMDQERSTKRFKSKYGQIQEAKKSGKKGDYKKMMQKRYGHK